MNMFSSEQLVRTWCASLPDRGHELCTGGHQKLREWRMVQIPDDCWITQQTSCRFGQKAPPSTNRTFVMATKILSAPQAQLDCGRWRALSYHGQILKQSQSFATLSLGTLQEEIASQSLQTAALACHKSAISLVSSQPWSDMARSPWLIVHV